MPLSMPYTDPYSGEEFLAYLYCTELNLNFAQQTGRITYGVFRSREAAWAGRPPVASIAYDVTPAGKPAQYGPAPLLTPGVPADPGTVNLETGEWLVAPTPEVPPTYGEPPLITPAFPSFSELMAENQAAMTAVSQAVYALALSRPEFAGAQEVE